MLWTNKYNPKNVKELVGDINSIMKLEDFVKNFRNYKKKGLILYGPTGSGKTEAVYAIAKSYDLEVLEINASDFRNKEHILEIVGKAIGQASLFNSGKIVLVDEIDGLSGVKDRGGAQALATLIDKSAFPLIMTANDPWQEKLSGLRRKSNMVEFAALNLLEIFKVLKRISDKENLKVSDKILKSIANRSGGDLRGAIMDLQLISIGREEILEENLDDINERNKEEEIFNLLKLIFKSKDTNLILETFDNTNLDFNEIKLWIDENMHKEYRGAELSSAYDSLSKSDIFAGRIMKRQYWRFLIYQKYFMSVGIALSKNTDKKGYINYKPTQRILKYWKAKMKYGKRKSICEKIGEKCHISTKRAMTEIYPYIKPAIKKEAKFLGLDEEEISWLD